MTGARTDSETPEAFARRVLSWDDADVADAASRGIDLAVLQGVFSTVEDSLSATTNSMRVPMDRIEVLVRQVLDSGFDLDTIQLWSDSVWGKALFNAPSFVMKLHRQGWDPYALQVLYDTTGGGVNRAVEIEAMLWVKTTDGSGISPALFVRAGVGRAAATEMLTELATASEADRASRRDEMLRGLEVLAALQDPPSSDGVYTLVEQSRVPSGYLR